MLERMVFEGLWVDVVIGVGDVVGDGNVVEDGGVVGDGDVVGVIDFVVLFFDGLLYRFFL